MKHVAHLRTSHNA